ncbi:MAG: CDP-2,3-bis-(O-geranylgeranyl)-sn-glycerol synthase [Candidatus Micrarchaeaceae archaeon]
MNIDIIYAAVIYPLIYIFPAYAANGAPVVFGGRAPLDFGRKFMGKRIFGDHKTIKGSVSSLMAGILVGLVLYPFMPYMLPIAILLSIGTNFGDLLGSFIKRRLGYPYGKSLFIMDQYGFYIFAILFALPLGHLPTLYGLAFITVVTGVLHLFTNMAAHRLRLKAVPW